MLVTTLQVCKTKDEHCFVSNVRVLPYLSSVPSSDSCYDFAVLNVYAHTRIPRRCMLKPCSQCSDLECRSVGQACCECVRLGQVRGRIGAR